MNETIVHRGPDDEGVHVLCYFMDVADPELERAILLSRGRRRGSAGDPGHGRDSGQQ